MAVAGIASPCGQRLPSINACSGKTVNPSIARFIASMDACRILGISYSHLQHCIARGYLDKVFGAGKLGIGVTAESITRFTTLRTRKTPGKERTK